MDARYDAQRGEFCAYVLDESETPFGLTLGNFKTFASSTPKGGIRGLWDADTDQIIFGAHQIATAIHRKAGSRLRASHLRRLVQRLFSRGVSFTRVVLPQLCPDQSVPRVRVFLMLFHQSGIGVRGIIVVRQIQWTALHSSQRPVRRFAAGYRAATARER